MDINEASESELRRIGLIGADRARQLVEYRVYNGPFQSWDHLRLVGRLEETTVKRLQAAGFTMGGHLRPRQAEGPRTGMTRLRVAGFGRTSA